MIKSFLKYNEWFRGDIIIISNDKFVQQKIRKHEKLKLVIPGPEIIEKTSLLIKELPKYKNLATRLFVFEIFKPSNYDFIIYADSDMLFQSTLDSDNILKNTFSAVSDPWFFRGYQREKKSCLKVPLHKVDSKNCYKNFFNSGFMIVGQEYRDKITYDNLISQIRPEVFKEFRDNLADEPILNSYFEKEVIILPIANNCPVHLIIEGHIINIRGNIHFTGKYKPWKFKSWFLLPLRNFNYFRHLLDWVKGYNRSIDHFF